MELTNSFTVPSDIDSAWAKLLDVESVAPAMPGAILTGQDGDEFSGTVKVKLGPVSLTYGGTARFVTKDDQQHHAVIEASGKETKGTSTARATVDTTLVAEAPDVTRVDVRTDLAITGRPAQFGRGVMQDVAGRIIDQFAGNLATMMMTTPEVAADEPAEHVSQETPPLRSVPPPPVKADDAIDLVGAAGVPVLKRVGPVVGLVLLVLAVLWWRRRR
ncbi:MAG: SRPBCC family protein [Candidatus Nanopelagicales bacterium]